MFNYKSDYEYDYTSRVWRLSNCAINCFEPAFCHYNKQEMHYAFYDFMCVNVTIIIIIIIITIASFKYKIQ